MSVKNAFRENLAVGDRLTCLENTYWMRPGGSGTLPPDLIVDKVGVTVCRGRTDDGKYFYLNWPLARDIISVTPDQISYRIHRANIDRDIHQVTWKKT